MVAGLEKAADLDARPDLRRNNSIYFSTNAFLPDYLASQGHADLIGAGLGWLNGAQFLATFILMLAAERLTGRTWPYLVFGLMTIAAIHRDHPHDAAPGSWSSPPSSDSRPR